MALMMMVLLLLVEPDDERVNIKKNTTAQRVTQEKTRIEIKLSKMNVRIIGK